MANTTADEKRQSVEAMPEETPETVEGLKVDTRHVDVAAAYLNNTEEFEPLTPEEEKKVLRKTDWILLPMVSILTCPLVSVLT